MLASKGVTAWRHALASLAPAGPAAPAHRAPGTSTGAADLPAPVAAELISALAAVALAATITGPAP